VFGIETSYPVKIAVSIIYARLPATNMEKNLFFKVLTKGIWYDNMVIIMNPVQKDEQI